MKIIYSIFWEFIVPCVERDPCWKNFYKDNVWTNPKKLCGGGVVGKKSRH